MDLRFTHPQYAANQDVRLCVCLAESEVFLSQSEVFLFWKGGRSNDNHNDWRLL